MKRSGQDWTDAFRVGKPVFKISQKIMESSLDIQLEGREKLHSPTGVGRCGMKTILLYACAAATAFWSVSCAPSTPDHRISERPAAFEALSEKHKDLVKRGELGKGMSHDAVALAWGSPSRRVEGLRDGKNMERWEYQGREAVVTHDFFGGYRSGYFGGYRYSGLSGGFGPQVTYVPYRKSTVWFVDGRVNEWESIR